MKLSSMFMSVVIMMGSSRWDDLDCPTLFVHCNCYDAIRVLQKMFSQKYWDGLYYTPYDFRGKIPLLTTVLNQYTLKEKVYIKRDRVNEAYREFRVDGVVEDDKERDKFVRDVYDFFQEGITCQMEGGYPQVRIIW